MSQTIKITAEYKCPKCGCCILRAVSQQVCEDGCEMWYECNQCGYDPCGPGDHVETVWGWQEELEGWAQQAWVEAIELK